MIGRGRDLSSPRDRITIEARAAEPQRLDRFLRENLEWKSRTRIQKAISGGHVAVNGEPSKASRKIRCGDLVTLHLSRGVGVPEDYDAHEIDVVYEDRWLVVVNKPPGILVHPVGRHVYDTLMNYLHHRYRDAQTEDGERVTPRLCHRLDRDTTGLLVVGKDPYCHKKVQYQFENRLVEKEYLALVPGRFPDDRAAIEIPIGEGRCLRSSLEHEQLKSATTRVRVIARLRDFTLLACEPKTGRQNQIRIHLAAAGYPIVGDTRYGGRSGGSGFPDRFLLHARALRFHHPRWKSDVALAAPLPPEFSALVDDLG